MATMLLRRLRCPHCAALIGIPARSAVGSRARCRACGQAFRVPSQHIERGPRAEAAVETRHERRDGAGATRTTKDEAASDLRDGSFRSTLSPSPRDPRGDPPPEETSE
jgi:hypothetical protein